MDIFLERYTRKERDNEASSSKDSGVTVSQETVRNNKFEREKYNSKTRLLDSQMLMLMEKRDCDVYFVCKTPLRTA
jgi:hypothetical protein